MRRAIPAFACAVAASLLVACGSTVQVSRGVSVDGPGVLNPAPLTSEGVVTPQGKLPRGVQATPVGRPPQRPGGSTPPVTTSTGPSTSPGLAQGAPVEVGIAYLSNVGEAFGQSNSGSSDLRLQADTMVSWVNKHGGLGGHRVRPVYATVDLTDTRPYDESEAAICESWTHDHHVVAGLFLANMNTTLADCLSRRGVMFLNMATYFFDSTDYTRIPLMVNPGELAGDVGARTYVDGLFAQRFLRDGDKVGVLRFSAASYTRAYDNAMKPALARGGISFIDEYAVNQPASTPDLANSAASVQNAVLKMRADGVGTVLFLCSGCAGVFMQYAESQQWRPRYGLSSWDIPHFRENSSPKAQLARAQGVGWAPLLDVPEPRAPRTNATASVCESLMHPIGQADTQDARIGSYAYCDTFLTLWRAAAGQRAISGASLVRGAEGLTTTYPSPFNLATSLGPGRHFGVAAARFFAYDTACPCFRYTSAAEIIQ